MTERIKTAELEREDDGICLICRNREKRARLLRIQTEDGHSVISFNICKDCLVHLGFAVRDAIDDFDDVSQETGKR